MRGDKNLVDDKSDEKTDRKCEESDRTGGLPPPRVSLRKRIHQEHHAGCRESRPRKVERPVGLFGFMLRYKAQSGEENNDPDGDIYVKIPAPAQIRGKNSSQ